MPQGIPQEMLPRKRGRKAAIGWIPSIAQQSQKGRFNATYSANAEANDKAYDLNKKSIQALDVLAKEYVDFEVTMANVTHEQEAGDNIARSDSGSVRRGRKILKEQVRVQDDLDNSSDALTTATKDFIDCRAVHEATGVNFCNAFREVSNRRAAHEELREEAEKVLQRTFEVKRKATEIQEDVVIHRERTRRITNTPGLKATNARDTHSLTCGAPDRESNETKYLREATELIKEWQ